MQNVSEIHSHIAARDVRPITNFDVADFDLLSEIGIHITHDDVSRMQAAMDSQQPTITTASIASPEQFLQNWLPGFVVIDTAPRRIDELTGVTTAGSFEDEEVVQPILELTGVTTPYGDDVDITYANWNVNYERRTIVRFESGISVKILEQKRAAKANINSADWKRKSAARLLEIRRNQIGFVGFNNGLNRTYGFLNDPGLPSYITVANGATGFPAWSTKTYLEITTDIRTMIASLNVTSDGVIDTERTALTLALPTSVNVYLSVQSQFGNTVNDWLRENYPKLRVVTAPELVGANGGVNAAYMYADTVNDTPENGESTDDNRTFDQYIQTKFMVLGVQQLVKGYQEGYSNASAGVMCKRPYAVYRASGI